MRKMVESLVHRVVRSGRLQLQKDNLLTDTRGAEFIEKLLIIALFIFVVVFGVSRLGQTVMKKLDQESKAIDNVKVQIPEPKFQSGSNVGE